jgi:membrane-associated phospholipid phosphatase
MELLEVLNYIGCYSPIILFILTILFLRNMHTYLTFFVSGFLLNNILNIILKLFIKEPRPLKDQKAIEIGVTNGVRIGFDKFGMPSGHAQNCSYCLAFITLVLNSPIITSMYIIITMITIFQRYINNNHSMLQLIIGSTIGLGFGYIIYLLGKQQIIGDIKMKKDDNAPL